MKELIFDKYFGQIGEPVHEFGVRQIEHLGLLVQWMKFIIKTPDLSHASPDARLIGDTFGPKMTRMISAKSLLSCTHSRDQNWE